MDISRQNNATLTEEECSATRCMDNQDENHLICVLCKRKVHSECSELPAYEIQRIVSSTSNSYKCIACVRVPKSLTKIMNENRYKKRIKEADEKDVIIKRLQHELSIKTNARDIIKNDLESFLTKKINEIETKTREVIKKELSSTTKTIEEVSKKTYAEIAKENGTELKTIMKKQKEDEKREELDIQSRKNNIVLHGVRERMDETEEEVQKADKEEVEELLQSVGVFDNVNVKTTHERIGKKSHKYRPLKVTFQNIQHKQLVMDNLYRIKTNAPYYRVSVTEDYTWSERKKIKEFCDRAKELNKDGEDNDYIWRVKGSSRTSLYLKKIIYETDLDHSIPYPVNPTKRRDIQRKIVK